MCRTVLHADSDGCEVETTACEGSHSFVAQFDEQALDYLFLNGEMELHRSQISNLKTHCL